VIFSKAGDGAEDWENIPCIDQTDITSGVEAAFVRIADHVGGGLNLAVLAQIPRCNFLLVRLVDVVAATKKLRFVRLTTFHPTEFLAIHKWQHCSIVPAHERQLWAGSAKVRGA
jgi:hypothetical protein